MKRLILVGSPRTSGRSTALAEMIFEQNIAEYPEDELFLVPISEVDVGPCVGCDGCKEESAVIVRDDEGHEISLMKHRCIYDDDMQMVYDLIDDADEIVVVCPVYFSGAPAPFKCLIDRLQPYFWTDLRTGQKRPATLHVIGEGGDPHGFDALVSEVRSAFSVAGFRLTRVMDWVGKLDANGEILEEAREIPEDSDKKPAKEAAASGSRKPDVKLDLSQNPQKAKKTQKNQEMLRPSKALNPQKSQKPSKSAKVQKSPKSKEPSKSSESSKVQKPSKSQKHRESQGPRGSRKPSRTSKPTKG